MILWRIFTDPKVISFPKNLDILGKNHFVLKFCKNLVLKKFRTLFRMSEMPLALICENIHFSVPREMK